VRVWLAVPEDHRGVCEFYERMFPDHDVPHQAHSELTDYWWVAGPIEKPRRPEEFPRPPDVGEIVCDYCLVHAVYLVDQGYREANS
jgi:hypothetical protein